MLSLETEIQTSFWNEILELLLKVKHRLELEEEEE